MHMPETTACLHCEVLPPASGLGLCVACNAVKGIRLLYLRRRDWNPQWELHLRRLAALAQQRLPLFDDQLSRSFDANLPSARRGS